MAAIDLLGAFSPWSERQFLAACAEAGSGAGALVAEVDGRVAGFLVWQRVLDEASIHNVAVAPRARRRGIARDLVRHLRGELPDDTTRCLLEVRASNHGALALYRGLGFVEDGRRRNYYPVEHGREDAVLMSLDLQEMQRERT
ncbi:ribosomal protein S18-alanine N-acetyltransferase [Parahaliea mediterranea]|uniref:[Ribosomal protein bS18]-alanine N-acetyltransferase n=1 Tax=Parahaliea mediterranea TaxID=651086 RepID=A0A939DI00_9GAMM|nr:ribosomal protein S18-alanine N-acetyltransferase [Parahaliea mediterranea]MBN7798516.1 ribosomal protein S18-alanine N-acetyltransferase [Parahaliea mediterranea]